MKIFEYNPILGTFSMGLEFFSQNEVVEVLNLRKNSEFSYNKTHKQWFLPNFSDISSYITENSYDLAILNPQIGEKIGKRGKINFKIDDIQACLQFLERELPKFAIFTFNLDVISLLNIGEEYVRDGFGQLSKDFLISSLQNLGYDAYLVAIDEANYGISMHRGVALYIATPKDFKMTFPAGLFRRIATQKYSKFRTIADAIGDLQKLGEWVPYRSQPQNVYQRHLRRGLDRVTWNFLYRPPNIDQFETISKIRQGSKAADTKEVRQKAGYVRPKWNRICPTLDDRFYMISSKAPCLHPLENRPFTIREGMRIMGLPDNVSFDLKTPRREIATMLMQSISPVIGEATAIALRSIQ